MQSNQIGNENKTLLFMNKILCVSSFLPFSHFGLNKFFQDIQKPPVGENEFYFALISHFFPSFQKMYFD